MFCSRMIGLIDLMKGPCTLSTMNSFEQFLEIDGPTNILQQNLRALATEMFKVSHILSLLFMRGPFNEKNVTYIIDNDNETY